MELVQFELQDKVATIKIQNGKVNAISHQVIAELNEALDHAEETGAVVIITGQEGIFSGGYDLKTMQKSMDHATALVAEGSTLTRRMLAFPTPIIAACSGHAIAKGSFILLCSDYRIGAKGPFKLGLNEVAIGMTMHQAGIEMARGRIPTNYFNRSVMNAEIFDVETAVDAGFLDKLVDADQLMTEAKALAEEYKKLNMKAHHGTKLKSRKALLEAMDAAIEVDRTTTF
ncbi:MULTISPECIES: crotonase/enoyl-CoA hydratase family protein [unclassified Oleiphilus]|nr:MULTISPECIES: crotonase/enoyl-CoA hydratase family protein [unclassified Oleiphilus]KZY48859.1 enoyl-CoA hydratase [Oleiphilus sp. HI0050]KZY75002.1 enoyl-CoA hydratase [Oleiphilus sp. HI0068]KZY81434.1 enoyl-CoA hydratase [Oleiphilus sp. HI0069]KZZ11756.1 enoyl-CoA hydratase [Oleiphilus sp. HI0078]KZZ20994.1 enoyl-CoA hydratase [Oleiphilus sp. HI0081]KZZ32759.1 enoyl-CoA hydratase [Oleiphilus sp. HI0085]